MKTGRARCSLPRRKPRINVDWSGKRDSNPQPTAWKAATLPIELFPHCTKFNLNFKIFFFFSLCSKSELRPDKPYSSLSRRDCLHRHSLPATAWWREKDSNLRRRLPTDLQSVPFGRSGISPYFSTSEVFFNGYSVRLFSKHFNFYLSSILES